MRSRFTLLVLAVVGLLATPLAGQSVAQGADTVRVIELSLDALHPDQIGPDTPFLQQLKDGSTWYEQHRSVMASETLPNHIAMGTGTYPGRNGIPNNGGRISPGDQDEADPDLRDPALRTADSFVTAIERVCPDLRTVTVFSKAYVYGTFAEDGADSDFPQPNFNIPESDHALDTATVGYILQELNTQDPPDYLFANLGDIDRAGHIDALGFTGNASTQLAAIQQTDKLVESIVQSLQGQGLWDNTVLVINSDHSQEWVMPFEQGLLGPLHWLDIPGRLEGEPTTAGKFLAVAEGGTGQIYLLDPDAADADTTMKAAYDLLSPVEGVREVMYREPNPLDPGKDLDTLHPDWHANTHRIGELFLVVESGYRSAAINGAEWAVVHGYHGHGETRHATAMVTGGWDGLAAAQSIAPSNPGAVDPYDDTAALPEQSEQVDFAPTFGWLLGVPDPGISGGGSAQWQGRVLSEAFQRQPDPACSFELADDGMPIPAPEPEPEPEPEAAPEQLPSTGGGPIAAAVVVAAAAVAARPRRKG